MRPFLVSLIACCLEISCLMPNTPNKQNAIIPKMIKVWEFFL